MFSLQSASRLCLIAVITLLSLLCAGCGSSSSSNSLTQAQAQAVSQQVSVALDQALAASFASDALTVRGEPGVHQNLAAVVRDIHPDQSSPCTTTDTGESCDFPVSYTGPCSGGGTISVAGDIDGSLTSSGDGSIQTALTITPTNCSVSTLVLNGDPNVAVAGQISFTQSALVYPIAFTETGAISYGSKSFETCQINVTDTISSATACTITGTVCGQPVTGSC